MYVAITFSFFSLRCCHAEEERSLLTQMRREMSEELTDTRQKLEESLRELEILKRKALRFEDENKQLVSFSVEVFISTFLSTV